MGIVINPACSFGASGDVGALNYSRWRGMWIARGKYTLTQTSSAKQLTQRARYTAAIIYWQDFTAAERELWTLYASKQRVKNRLQQEYTPTGYHCFLGMAIQAQVVGYSIPDEPPTEPMPYSVFGVEVTQVLQLSVWKIKIDPTEIPTGSTEFKIQYQYAPPFISGARNPKENEWRTGGAWLAYDYWVLVPTDNDRYRYFRVRAVDKFGRRTNWVYGDIFFTY